MLIDSGLALGGVPREQKMLLGPTQSHISPSILVYEEEKQYTKTDACLPRVQGVVRARGQDASHAAAPAPAGPRDAPPRRVLLLYTGLAFVQPQRTKMLMQNKPNQTQDCDQDYVQDIGQKSRPEFDS